MVCLRPRANPTIDQKDWIISCGNPMTASRPVLVPRYGRAILSCPAACCHCHAKRTKYRIFQSGSGILTMLRTFCCVSEHIAFGYCRDNQKDETCNGILQRRLSYCITSTQLQSQWLQAQQPWMGTWPLHPDPLFAGRGLEGVPVNGNDLREKYG
jgi:hypothetical protein